MSMWITFLILFSPPALIAIFSRHGSLRQRISAGLSGVVVAVGVMVLATGAIVTFAHGIDMAAEWGLWFGLLSLGLAIGPVVLGSLITRQMLRPANPDEG